MTQQRKTSSPIGRRQDLPSRLGWRPSGFRDLQPEQPTQPRPARRERPYTPSVEARVAEAVDRRLAELRIVESRPGEFVIEQPQREPCWWRDSATGLPDCGRPATEFVEGYANIGVAGATMNAGLHLCERHAADAIALRDQSGAVAA